MIGIYSITNIVNGKRYIGKSKNIKSRWSHHKGSLRRGKHENDYLQNSWNKYGEDNFKFEVIYVANHEDELNEKEIYYINKFNTLNSDLGYNIRSGGEGGSMSESSKVKMRAAMKNNGRAFFTDEQARHIKMMLWCLMDRNEIANIYNVDPSVIKGIANGNGYSYILEDINNDIKNMKRKLIKERNDYILKLFDEGMRIIDIHNKTNYSLSIIEKCVYKYRNSVEETRNKYQEMYDKTIQLYNEGYKPYVISKMLNIGNTTVNRYIKGENNPYKELNFKKIKEKDRQNILNMYFNEKFPIKEIAEKYSVSRNTIEFYINNYKYANTEIS